MNFHHDAIIRKFSAMPDADKASFAHITKHLLNVQDHKYELLNPAHADAFPMNVTVTALYETYDTLPLFTEIKRLLTKLKPITKLPKGFDVPDDNVEELLATLNQIILVTLVKRVVHKTQDVAQLTRRLTEMDKTLPNKLLNNISYETLPGTFPLELYELLESYL